MADPAARAGPGAGQGRCAVSGAGGSGGLAGSEEDVVAEGLELAFVAAGLAVGVGVLRVVIGPEVAVAGGGVVEQVPDDECDTRSHMVRVNLGDWRASMT